MTIRPAKIAASTLSLALLLLSPGIEPYAAAAGNLSKGAPMAMPSFAAPVTGAAPASPAFSAVALTPGLSAPLNAGLALPSAALPSGAAASVPSASAIPASNAASFAAKPQAAASSLKPGAAAVTPAGAAAAVTAQQQLSLGAERVGAAAQPSFSAERGAAALDQVFSGSLQRAGDAAGPASGKAGAGLPSLSASSLGQGHGGAGSSQEPAAPQAPEPARQSLSRSARVGLLAAVVPLAITFATMAVASALGYHFHAGYQNPFPVQMTIVTALTSLISAAFMAPVSEEMIFRGGIMGGIRKMTAKIPLLGQFWLPAALSSVLFVSVHELSDPVLFATRFVHSMILSYAFSKEGFTGSMFAHGIFNGLLVMPLVLGVLLPGALATAATLALTPLTLFLAFKAFKRLRAEQPDKKAGRIQAFKVSPKAAVLLALALLGGFVFIVGNAVWLVGALGWLYYAYKTRKES